MGDLMNEFMKKKAISMLRMELIITLIYIGAWGIWGIMAIVDLNVAKIFFFRNEYLYCADNPLSHSSA
ncbi:MAG: hypothetical protein ACLVHE_00655 [Dialister invisus]